MKITLKVLRFNPEKDDKPFFQHYSVDAESSDRVLDALMDIKINQDGSLGFRKSCAHGICGSDAMRINGKERLACKTLIGDVAENSHQVITIEPLRHMRVEQDLMVDQSGFLQSFRSVKPFLIPAEEVKEKERIQTPEQRELFDDATKCINCGACYSACPVLDKNQRFIGPAAIVQAARFVDDSRDQGLAPRLEILDHPNGVWSCENHFECTRVCPREIKVTKLINLMKRKIKKYRQERGELIHDTSQ